MQYFHAYHTKKSLSLMSFYAFLLWVGCSLLGASAFAQGAAKTIDLPAKRESKKAPERAGAPKKRTIAAVRTVGPGQPKEEVQKLKDTKSDDTPRDKAPARRAPAKKLPSGATNGLIKSLIPKAVVPRIPTVQQGQSNLSSMTGTGSQGSPKKGKKAPAKTAPAKGTGVQKKPPTRRTIPPKAKKPKLTRQQKRARAFAKKFWGKGMFLGLLMLFIGGFLVSLTPCVYPMIPITIAVIGASAAREEGKRGNSFLLSLCYVLGMAFLYSGLALIAAFPSLVGQDKIMFGSVAGNPYILTGIVVLFFAMAMSMFGFFDLNIPSSWQTKLANVQGRGYLGVFILGLIGGVLAAPCAGPVILGLLAYIATEQAPFFGAFLLFVFSMGIGVPFLLLGAGVVKSLPRSGMWMNEVKKFFGVLLLGASMWYGYQLADRYESWHLFCYISGGILLFLGVFSGAFRPYSDGQSKWTSFKQGFGLLCILFGLYLGLGTLVSQGFIVPPLSKLTGKTIVKTVKVEGKTIVKPIQLPCTKGGVPVVNKVKTAQRPVLRKDPNAAAIAKCKRPAGYPADKPFWFKDERKGIACAKLLKRPITIDFWATWCNACIKMEKTSFNHAMNVKESRRFVMIKVKYNEESKEGKRLNKKYNLDALPRVHFFNSKGKLLTEPAIEKYMGPKELNKVMRSVK